MRAGLSVVLTLSVVLSAGAAVGAPRHPAGSGNPVANPAANPANDRLMKSSPAERIAELAKVVGHWCIGTEAFEMGSAKSGPAAGNAYWSVRCADGSTWAVQIDPLAEVTAIDCDSFKEKGGGKECFRKF